MRRRLDKEMVRRGLVASTAEVDELIAADRVTVDGALASKPQHLVTAGQALGILDPPPKFVSRAGAKIDAAFERFGVSVEGLRVLDAGSSTGGFSDCALQRGASAVVCVDVGTNQLHERLRSNPRVTVYEQTNVRDVDIAAIGGPVDVVVADLSFVSLRAVLASLAALVAPTGAIVTLIKPQFEATKPEADRGRGIISDPDIWLRVLGEVRSAALSHHLGMMEVMVSPITGTHGNVEFVALLRPASAATTSDADLASVVARAEEAC